MALVTGDGVVLAVNAGVPALASQIGPALSEEQARRAAAALAVDDDLPVALSAPAVPPPQGARVNLDFWTAPLGVNVCGTWLANAQAAGLDTGVHSHGDGLIYIHPFTAAEAGNHATLGLFLERGKWKATQDTQPFVLYSGVLKSLAIKLSKICNDLRLLASGPRAGLHEITLPAMQPGSSIMPGKVNPVIPEVMNQICFRIIGNDLTVTMAAEAGDVRSIAGDADQTMAVLVGLAPHRSAHPAPVHDAMAQVAQRQDRAVNEGNDLGQPSQAGRDPAAVLLGELLRLVHAAARRNGENHFARGGIDGPDIASIGLRIAVEF